MMLIMGFGCMWTVTLIGDSLQRLMRGSG